MKNSQTTKRPLSPGPPAQVGTQMARHHVVHKAGLRETVAGLNEGDHKFLSIQEKYCVSLVFINPHIIGGSR